MKYFRAGVVSVILHALVIGGLLFYAVIKGCLFKKQKVDLVEFTIAVDPVEVEEEKPKEPEPPKVEPKPATPKPDDIAIPKKKPEPPKPPKKPDPPKPEKKPEPPKKPKPQDIKQNKRVTKKPPVQTTVTPKEKQTLSDEEIKKWLDKRVKIGATTSLPQNDLSLNFSLIKNALYDTWNQPPREAAGSRPADIAFTVGPGGRISNPRLQTSSGSASFDQSALDAVKRVGSVPGLSAAFLKEFSGKDIVIGFALSD